MISRLCIFSLILAGVASFQPSLLPAPFVRADSRRSSSLELAAEPFMVSEPSPSSTAMVHEEEPLPLKRLLIHWRGEKDTGYSKPFRQLEFTSALEATLGVTPDDDGLSMTFINALNYSGQIAMADINIVEFNEAMQFIEFSNERTKSILTREAVIETAKRCSLVHAVYEIMAEAGDLNGLVPAAIEGKGFADMYKGGVHEEMTWCFRARNYKDLSTSDTGREKRYSSRARSMALEKEGLKALTELLLLLGGKVNLVEPDCKIYIFDGLQAEGKILARQIATGPKTSLIAPATRICITNTPLCPIASFSLCNVARITNSSRILDPYAGSCATLLAAAMIAPQSRTVGIEIAHNGLVNRDDIRKDFFSRNLTQPLELLLGDSAEESVRNQARDAIGSNHAFDVILADPPYGIRESTGYNEGSPLEELCTSIAKDRDAGHRLLKRGGRLVAFVPVADEQTLTEMLPDPSLTERAGLVLEVSREQPLNKKLSRWLVSFVCAR